MAREQVRLTGAPETPLATLYGRALDAREADPILGDELADVIVRRLDYDFSKLRVSRTDAMGVAIRFPSGQLVFDSWNSLGARFGKHQRAIRATGAITGGWGIDDPRDLERWIPGLRLVAAQDFMHLPELARAPAPTRALVAVMRHVRVLRDIGLILRYSF